MIQGSAGLKGRALSRAEVEGIEAWFGQALPSRLSEILLALPLVGLEFELDEEEDLSKQGARFRWMTPEGMKSEAIEAYPGVVARRHGYFPVGDCMEGSGDPYFIRLSDLALVRIPHAAVHSGPDWELDQESIQDVTASIEEFIEKVAPA